MLQTIASSCTANTTSTQAQASLALPLTNALYTASLKLFLPPQLETVMLQVAVHSCCSDGSRVIGLQFCSGHWNSTLKHVVLHTQNRYAYRRSRFNTIAIASNLPLRSVFCPVCRPVVVGGSAASSTAPSWEETWQMGHDRWPALAWWFRMTRYQLMSHTCKVSEHTAMLCWLCRCYHRN